MADRRKGQRGPKPLPVQIRGVHYPSTNDAARALKVSPTTIYNLQRLGRVDRAGTNHRGQVSARRAPISIGPLRFESRTAAYKSLRMSKSTFFKWLATGDHTALIARAMQIVATKESALRKTRAK